MFETPVSLLSLFVSVKIANRVCSTESGGLRTPFEPLIFNSRVEPSHAAR